MRVEIPILAKEFGGVDEEEEEVGGGNAIPGATNALSAKWAEEDKSAQ